MSITLTLEQTDYMDRINANYVKISELLKPYSSEYSGVMNWAKKFENKPTRQDYMDILRFRRADRIMPFHRFEYQKFQECGKAERTLDFKYVFTQLIVEYPETEATLKEWSEKTKYEKEVRKNNAEINQALVALDADFKTPQDFRTSLGRLTDYKACINCGKTSVSVFTWNPNHVGKYRTSNRIWFADIRKTPLTKELLQEAADTIEERWREDR